VHILDFFCIIDTGSSDGTEQIIRDYFEQINRTRPSPIRGVILHEPFRDFGYNRSHALRACRDLPADYILLLDADMRIEIDPRMSPNNLNPFFTDDLYFYFKEMKACTIKIFVLSVINWYFLLGSYPRIVKVGDGTNYKGQVFDKSIIFIRDIATEEPNTINLNEIFDFLKKDWTNCRTTTDICFIWRKLPRHRSIWKCNWNV